MKSNKRPREEDEIQEQVQVLQAQEEQRSPMSTLDLLTMPSAQLNTQQANEDEPPLTLEQRQTIKHARIMSGIQKENDTSMLRVEETRRQTSFNNMLAAAIQCNPSDPSPSTTNHYTLIQMAVQMQGNTQSGGTLPQGQLLPTHSGI